MKRIAIALAALLVASCVMTNDAGLDVVQWHNEFGTMHVDCVFKKGPTQ